VQGRDLHACVLQRDVAELQLAAGARQRTPAASASSALSSTMNMRSAAATPREMALCTPVIRRSEGMIPIIAVMRVTNCPAFRRPASASWAEIQTIDASASAASICTVEDAEALVASILRFRRRMRLAIFA
jgi:hypothetical protein